MARYVSKSVNDGSLSNIEWLNLLVRSFMKRPHVLDFGLAFGAVGVFGDDSFFCHIKL